MAKGRNQRLGGVALLFLSLLLGIFLDYTKKEQLKLERPPITSGFKLNSSVRDLPKLSAETVLSKIEIKGRAPKTSYARSFFGEGWAKIRNCDTRNTILKRDLTQVRLSQDNCRVLSGLLNDPYTAKTIGFIRGQDTSTLVQIDHVVALSDAWQKGAQLLTPKLRLAFANDPLNLLAVSGNANQDKSDGDAATWLPPNKSFRCDYIARQIAVKYRYSLWVTLAERSSMHGVLKSCPGQILATS